MTDYRSASQILLGHLPDQTVDVRGGVWRVGRWLRPHLEAQVDDQTLRQELRRLATEWSLNGTDGGFVQDLLQGAPVRVLSLDRDRGIELEPFPRVWICGNRNCRRLLNAPDVRCPCGSQ